MRCRTFTIDPVLEWVEKYENIDGRFRFFEVYARFLHLPTDWEASSFNENRWLNGCGTYSQAFQALHAEQGQK